MFTLLNTYFCYSAGMSSTFEIGRKKLVKNLSCRLLVNKSSRQNQHVGVVMEASQVSNLGRPSQSGTYSLMLIERHAHSFSRTTHTDTGIDVTPLNGIG